MLYYLSFRIILNDDLSASYSSKSHGKCIEAPKPKHINTKSLFGLWVRFVL